jgi:uncharacterized membrane protein
VKNCLRAASVDVEPVHAVKCCAHKKKDLSAVTVLNHEIRISAPIERVWAILADLEAVQRYNPTVKKAVCVSEARHGVGASRRCELIPRGSVTERITAWLPMQAIAMELVEHDWPVSFMRWRTEIAGDHDSTRVVQRLEYQVKFGVFGKLLDAMVMRKKLDRTIAVVFDRLKAHLEDVSLSRPHPSQAGL